MANLLAIANLAWLQINPGGNDESKVRLEQLIADAKTEYAYQLWLKLMAEKREEGMLEVPSYLLTEKEMEVLDNQMDVSYLKIMRSLPSEIWLQNIGGLSCTCRYVKSTLNLSQVLCDDDSLGDNARTFFVVGKKIIFPQGTHKDKLPLIYANGGENIDDFIEIDESIGAVVRRTLVEMYLGKVPMEDKTNNSNPDK